MTPRTLLSILITPLFFLLGPGPMKAQGNIPLHELRLVEGNGVAPLGLEGWLVESGRSYTVEVVADPTFGKMVGEEYHPFAEFFVVGADHVGIEIEVLGYPPQRHDFLFVALEPQTTLHTLEDFESGWPAGWIGSGDAQTLQWEANGIDGASLRGFLPSPDASAAIGPPNDGHQGAKGYHAQGTATTTIPDPPDEVVDGVVTVLRGSSHNSLLAPEARVELRLEAGTYEMRATYHCFTAGCRNSSTPWQAVPMDQPVRIELWAGPLVYHHHLGERTSAIRFTIDRPDPLLDTVDWIEVEVDMDEFQIGFIDPVDFDGLGMLFEDVETWDELDFSGEFVIARDGFEDGGFAPVWTSVVGPMAAEPGAAIEGDWGVAIDVAALRSNGGQALLITEDLASEETFGALFRVDFSALSLEPGDRVELIRASGGDSLGEEMNARLFVREAGGGLEIRLRVRQDSGSWRSTPWRPITRAAHSLAVRWLTGAGDGWAGLFIDGQEADRLLGLSNSDQAARLFAVGVLNPILAPGEGALPESILRLDEVTLFR